MDTLTRCRVVTRDGLTVYEGERGLCYDYVMQAMAKGSEPGFLRIEEVKEEEA